MLDEGSDVTIGKEEDDNTTFEQCSAKGEDKGGKGGALYILIPEEHGDVIIDNVKFRNNTGSQGNDFYAKAESEDVDDIKEMFKFLNDKDKYEDYSIEDEDGNVENFSKDNNNNNNKMKPWLIAVIVIAVVVVLVIIGIIITVVCVLKKKKKKNNYEYKDDLRKNEELKQMPEDNQENGEDNIDREDISY